MWRIIKHIVIDIMRSRVVLAYLAFLFIAGFAIFNLEDTSAKGLMSMLNIVLFIVPLICLVFATIYIYNASEFIELLVSQPIRRKQIWMSIYAGLSASLVFSFAIGFGLPMVLYAMDPAGILIFICGILLTFIFTGIALYVGVLTRDKARGMGKVILLWLYFTILFDGLLLMIIFQFSDYPIERMMIGLSALNPIDLARVMTMLQLDISALMGFTGAIFREFLGSAPGMIFALVVLIVWAVVPVWLSLRKFRIKDL